MFSVNSYDELFANRKTERFRRNETGFRGGPFVSEKKSGLGRTHLLPRLDPERHIRRVEQVGCIVDALHKTRAVAVVVDGGDGRIHAVYVA